jgi:esterase/lipase superfamily enzyme
MTDAAQLTDTIASIWPDLPGVIGPAFEEFARECWQALRNVETAADADVAARLQDVIKLFRAYPGAYSALVQAQARAVQQKRRAVSGALITRPPTARYVTIPVAYATDRADGNANNPAERYSGSRGHGLRYGVARVSIPDDHKRAVIEIPKWWKLEFRATPDRHLMLFDVEPLEPAAFVERSRALLGLAVAPDLLVVVHGYNVAFDAAAARAAQLAWDIDFQGVPMLYSWPSEGRVLSYPTDEGNIRWTEDHFRAFLNTVLTELGAKAVHVLAHSMGNRAVVETLRHFDPRTLADGAARLRQIIFAAPDIDSQTFEQVAATWQGRAERFTLYASRRDKALAGSQKFHTYPRAGDAGDGLVVVEGVDTIDASEIDISLLGLGHSYVGDVRAVVQDLFNLIRHGHSPEQRGGLAEALRGTTRYWRLER